MLQASNGRNGNEATGRTRRTKVRRGRPCGQLHAGEKVLDGAPAALLRWFRMACARGFLAGAPKLQRAAGLIVSLAGDPRPRSALEVASMAGCSVRTYWSALHELEAVGFAPVERFERDGALTVELVRGRPVPFRKYGTNRMVARYRRSLLRWIAYPRSEGSTSIDGERGESVRTSSKICKVPARGGFVPMGEGDEQGTRGEGAAPLALEESRRRALELVSGIRLERLRRRGAELGG